MKQSTLDPASDAAREIADLWWAMLIGSWIVFGVVVLLLAIAVLRRRSTGSARAERRAKTMVLVGGVAAPAVVLSILFAFGLETLPATSAPKPGAARLTVSVIGHQWFWEVHYPAPLAAWAGKARPRAPTLGTPAVTANEIHIPAGVPVRLAVRTADVIHSFWVPQLNRKIDLVPGRTNEIVLEAGRPGVFRGQCAEYCGLQHAHMAFLVIADPPARFREWLANEAGPARTATSSSQRAGRTVFLHQACAGCHTIRGTDASGDVGPDLTHLAGRSTLAAVTIPNNAGYLGGWILDPQHVKPGNKMPGLDLSGDQLQALLDYLQSLR